MKLSRVNNFLIALIVLVNGYVIVTPFLPRLLYAQAVHSGQPATLSRKLHTAPAVAGATIPDSPRSNELIVPSMALDQPILEGRDTYAVLDKGILRWPAGSTPDKGSNTILIGHRFTYTNPRGVFYFLNKLDIGDELGIIWQSRQYTYKVSDVRIVAPSEMSILAPSSDARLTLFTCTPLWSPKQRLVVTALLETTQEPSTL